MSEQTLEERKEALRRQQDELAREEAELLRQARLKREEAEQKEREEAEAAKQRRRAAIVNQIRVFLEIGRPGLVFTLTDSRFEVVSDDIPYTVWLEFNQKYDAAKYAYNRTPIAGHYDIAVGPYGEKKRFPANKEGNNKHDKIAAELLRRYDEHVASVKRERTRTANKEASAPDAERLRQQFGLHQYGSITVRSSTAHGDVVVKLPEAVSLTPEKAEQLLTTLKQIGLIA